MITFRPFKALTLYTRFKPDEVARRLGLVIRPPRVETSPSDGEFHGTVDARSFDIQREKNGNKRSGNPFMPYIHGTIATADNGSVINVDLTMRFAITMSDIIFYFMLIIAPLCIYIKSNDIILLLIPGGVCLMILMNFALSFSEASKAKKFLSGTLQATETGPQIG